MRSPFLKGESSFERSIQPSRRVSHPSKRVNGRVNRVNHRVNHLNQDKDLIQNLIIHFSWELRISTKFEKILFLVFNSLPILSLKGILEKIIYNKILY
jgi:hypothetical protein